MTRTKIKILDLFAGCGGLTDGFMQTHKFVDIAAVEWKGPQVQTLKNRLLTKWGKKDVDESVLHFDIQREEELFQRYPGFIKFFCQMIWIWLLQKKPEPVIDAIR